MGLIPTSSRIPVGKRADNDDLAKVLKEIGDLIGMDNIKTELNQLIALGRLIALRRERDIPMEKVSLHLIFTGPPGTGKTIMARKIGKLFKAIGLLRKGDCIEVDRSKLVGAHLGAAGQLVAEAVKNALDGVLFIDRAEEDTLGWMVPDETEEGGYRIDPTTLKEVMQAFERLSKSRKKQESES